MTEATAPVTEGVTSIENQRYPIGQFEYGKTYSEEELQQAIKKLEEFPARLKKLVTGMKDEQLDTPYREGGWTVRQVIHHIADSHMNAYIRFKLALTEDKPTIKPYNEKAWAEMIDARTLAPSVSLSMLAAIHERWTTILKAMKPEDFNRSFFHPENMRFHELSELVAMYAWHSDHHYEHVSLVRKITPSSSPKTRKAVPGGTTKAKTSRKKS